MDDWIDYYNSTHTIYASRLHRDLHFQVIAKDIIGYISAPDAAVLDYACGEALSAAKVADACGKLYLAEPAPGVRGRLIARFAPNTKIRVRSLDDLRNMTEKSDRSRGHELGRPIHDAGRTRRQAFAVVKRLLKPGGRLVVGDVLRPEVGMARDVGGAVALRAHPRLPQGCPDRAGLDRAVGLPAIALEKWGCSATARQRCWRSWPPAGFTASRAELNIGHNPWRMTFVARNAS